MQYELIRSQRKSLALKVVDGRIVIRAPYHTSQQYIDAILAKRKPWIEQVRVKQADHAQTQNLLCDNGRIWLRGKLHHLEVIESDEHRVELIDAKLSVKVKSRTYHRKVQSKKLNTHIKKVLEQWLAEQASLVLYPKLEKFSQLTGLFPQAINIRQFKARWGSCDNFGKVQLNYLLMMVPEPVIDYVVIHELCHLKHLNHSSQFWQLVALHCPEFENAKSWLKDHQAKLIWRNADLTS